MLASFPDTMHYVAGLQETEIHCTQPSPPIDRLLLFFGNHKRASHEALKRGKKSTPEKTFVSNWDWMKRMFFLKFCLIEATFSPLLSACLAPHWSMLNTGNTTGHFHCPLQHVTAYMYIHTHIRIHISMHACSFHYSIARAASTAS